MTPGASDASDDDGRDPWWSYAVLCDGASQPGDGARAADTAVAAFTATLEVTLGKIGSPPPTDPSPPSIADAVWQAVEAAHVAVRALSRDPLLRGSSTSLEAVLLIPAGPPGHFAAAIAHVGDGNVWSLSASSGLEPKTPLVPRAEGHPPGALGTDAALRGKVLWAPVQPGSQIVVTSDGFRAGLRRRDEADESAGIARASYVAASLSGPEARPAEIAECLGALGSGAAVDDVTVVVLGSVPVTPP